MRLARVFALTPLIALLACAQPEARAGLIITVKDMAAPAGVGASTDIQTRQGGMGAFEVLVSYVGTGSSIDLAGFSTRVTVSATAGVTFTSISENTAPDTFLFAGLLHDPLLASDGNPPNAPVPTETPFPTPVTSLSFNDFTTPDLNTFQFPFTTINPGQAFGLGLIRYSVASTAATGRIALTVDPTAANGGQSDLGTPNGFSVISGVVSGAFVISPASAVPEPASLVLMISALGPLALDSIRRRRRVGFDRR